MSGAICIARLTADDVSAAKELNRLYATEFSDPESYALNPPGAVYLASVLAQRNVIALVAHYGEEMTGGLVAYVLPKLEKARSEIYIYDLAVAEAHRRNGIATALIEELRRIAREIGAWVVYVQADYGDDPAVALYEKLGTREDVMHFDIAPEIPR